MAKKRVYQTISKGDLISDVRTHFVVNSTDYQVLRSLLVLQ